LKSIARSLIAIVSLTAHAGLSLWENREPGRPETEMAAIDLFAQSDSLRHHMTGAELHDLQTPSRLFGSFMPPAVLQPLVAVAVLRESLEIVDGTH
jgi:hypothetical protein